jgi:hypothetical protein
VDDRRASPRLRRLECRRDVLGRALPGVRRVGGVCARQPRRSIPVGGGRRRGDAGDVLARHDLGFTGRGLSETPPPAGRFWRR